MALPPRTTHPLSQKRGAGRIYTSSNKEYTFSEPGKHHFKAQKGNYFSNQLTVEAQPNLLSLRVNKENITADGMEEATFSVYQDGEKLTSEGSGICLFVDYK